MLASKRIYVVDDEQLITYSLCLILNQSGYETESFASAEDVLDRLKQSEPDLVLTDVVMNGPMTGLELAEKIAYEHPLVHVLLMSGQAKTTELLDGFRNRGLNPRVHAKPLAPDQLIAEIRHMLAR